MKRTIFLTALLLAFVAMGCQSANTAPNTTQPPLTVNQINKGLATGARLGYTAVVVLESVKHSQALAKIPTTDVAAIAKENARYKKVTDAEAIIPPLLDDLDKYANGDPIDFADLLKQEMVMIVTIGTESNGGV